MGGRGEEAGRNYQFDVSLVSDARLTDNHCQDHKDDDDEDYPQLDILPPKFALEACGSALEHVSILVQVLCIKEGEEHVVDNCKLCSSCKLSLSTLIMQTSLSTLIMQAVISIFCQS